MLLVRKKHFPLKYGIDFDADGGTASESSRLVVAGDKIGQLPTAEKDGYNFDGWYVGETKLTESTVPTDDVDALASWTTLFRKSYYPTLTTDKVLAFEDLTLDQLRSSSTTAAFYGSYVSNPGPCKGYHVKDTTNGITIQYQYNDLGTLKCVIVEYSQEGNDIYAQVVNKCYKEGSYDVSVDITTLSPSYSLQNNYYIYDLNATTYQSTYMPYLDLNLGDTASGSNPCYFVTDYVPNSNTKMEFCFGIPYGKIGSCSTTTRMQNGCRNSWGQQMFQFAVRVAYNDTTNRVIKGIRGAPLFLNNSTSTIGQDSGDDTVNMPYFNNQKFIKVMYNASNGRYCYDTTLIDSGNTYTNKNSIPFWIGQISGSNDTTAGGRVMYVKFYEDNNVVRDYRPTNERGVPEFKDLVNGTYLARQGNASAALEYGTIEV